MAAHPGAGDQPRIRQLDGTAQPPGTAGRQRIHGDDGCRAHRSRCRPDQLTGLHPRPAQHLRTQGGELPHAPERLLPAADQMPGHQQVIHRRGADGITGHVPVTDARRQHRSTGQELRQQGGKTRRLLRKGLALQLHGDVAPHGLSQRSGSRLVQDPHLRHGDALPPLRPGDYPGEFSRCGAACLQIFRCLQRQVRPDLRHTCVSPSHCATKCGRLRVVSRKK